VCRYTPGKADWFASGLPREGTQGSKPQAGDRARRDVPTCHLADRIDAARERARAAGWDVCVVVNDQRVVLGLLHKEALDSDPQTPVTAVMEAGPTTYRPNKALDAIVEYMRKNERDYVLITTPDGQLIGILYRQDAERTS
jgi:CBS domain-containing protein